MMLEYGSKGTVALRPSGSITVKVPSCFVLMDAHLRRAT